MNVAGSARTAAATRPVFCDTLRSVGMQEPRFYAESAEELTELARRAQPPVRTGDVAELVLPRRRVLVQVTSVEPLVVWDQIP